MSDKRTGKKKILKRHAISSTKKYSIELAFEYFLHAKVAEGLRKRTLEDHKRHFQYFMEWLHEHHPDIDNIDEVTTSIIREYVYYMSNERPNFKNHPFKSDEQKQKIGLSPSTVNIRLTNLKTFFNFLVKENIISHNPTENVRKMRVEEDTIGAFTDDQIDLLLSMPDRNSYAGYRDYILMRLMLETGMRINEVLSLGIGNIDFKTRLITLTGQQNKNRRVRVIPISKEMAKLLLDLINESKTYFPECEKIFLTNYGEPLSKITITHRIKDYGKKAGITGVRVSPHTFRHTFAKNFLMSGGDIIALQRILGHSTMDMVRKYVQHTPDDLLSEHERFVMNMRLKHKRNWR